MRVVAGTAGGLKLTAPSGHATRPTSDRVREATFNALGSMGVVEDAEVAVLESDRPIDPGVGWSVARSRSYGTTVVTICRRCVADSQETAP